MTENHILVRVRTDMSFVSLTTLVKLKTCLCCFIRFYLSVVLVFSVCVCIEMEISFAPAGWNKSCVRAPWCNPNTGS